MSLMELMMTSHCTRSSAGTSSLLHSNLPLLKSMALWWKTLWRRLRPYGQKSLDASLQLTISIRTHLSTGTGLATWSGNRLSPLKKSNGTLLVSRAHCPALTELQLGFLKHAGNTLSTRSTVSLVDALHLTTSLSLGN